MTIGLKRMWMLGSAGMCAVVAPTIAFAAEAGGQTAPVKEAGTSAPQAADAEEQDGVADIIVTANRRAERLQAVPVTVTVVDGGQLTRQNVNAVEDLTRAAPALNTAGPSGFGALSIRGIGNLSFARSSEGSVGVVVDGVALANTSVNPPLLFDIARVEVLEGPQGMLFGRNASAGVLNITTVAPDPSRIAVIFHGDIGSRENYIARGALNLPLSRNAALRVAGSFNQAPRMQYNRLDGSWIKQRTLAGRARLLWEPTDTLTINLAGDYTDNDNDGGAPWAVYSTTPGSLIARRLAACGVVIGPKNTEGCINDDLSGSKTSFGYSRQVDLDLGGVTLTSITAYRGVNSSSTTDIDATSADRYIQTVADRARNFSQELRLSSPSGGLIEYVAGLYYFNGKTHNRTGQLGRVLADLTAVGACPLPPVASALCTLPLGQFRMTDTRTRSYAAFGQATINATDKLRFILGGRVGREKVSADTTASKPEVGSFFDLTRAPAVSGTVRDDYFIYRLGAQYDVSSNLMIFATYTRGYKGPAINDGAGANQPLIVRPEIPKAAEIGFKATLAGGRAAFNATAFYTKVTDFQAQFWDPARAAFIFGNAPSLTSKGVTANLFGRPFKGMIANVGLTYNDAKYGPGYVVVNAANVLIDADGKQLVGAARWKVTASGEYSTAVSNDVHAFIQADMVYRTKGFSNAANDPIVSVKGSAIFGGRIGIRSTDGGLGAAIFARNIFNTFRTTTRFATPVAGQQLDSASFSQFSGPESNRVIGLSLDVKF